jgi:signal transduction histidine kinase
MSFLNSLMNVGVGFAKKPSEKRSIFLTNVISLILFAAGMVLFALYFYWYGGSVITFIIPIIGILSLSCILFNSLDLTAISRFWVCLFLPISIIALSIYSKTIYYDQQEELDYYTFRIVILSCCIFPPMFFSTSSGRERTMLLATLGIILGILILHDPLHSYFGVGYQQAVLKQSNYAFTNVIIVVMYLLMTGAVIFTKWISEVNEAKANALIEELNVTNSQLKVKNSEIEIQNREILDQTDKLNLSRQKLADAYKLIEEQRNLLYVQNKNLSSELIEKNNELTETNNELIKHNNELRQFSYTVSHNLRGPVASLMGLLKLFQPEKLSPDNADIFTHIETSTQRLDNIIKDLSKIIDIRNDIFQIRQQIDLAHEAHEILQVLHREIISHDVSVNLKINETRVIYSVRPMVHSILYNLISNAIKYRSDERPAEIEIITGEDNTFYTLEVRDNGLGIDLARDRDNLFKLYKRFHHHTEGKGLGLYLVKLQAEALGGTIHVNSELNHFTSFVVHLRKPENAERQVLYQDETAEIFFDATLNCIGTHWSKPTYHQYKSVLRKVLEFIKAYNTPNFLADLSAETNFKDREKHILFTQITEEAARNGLHRLAAFNAPGDLTNESHLNDHLKRMGIELKYFASAQQAIEWIGLYRQS